MKGIPRAARAKGAAPQRAKHPRAIAFGDSHSHALQRAIEKRKGKGQPIPLAVYRLLKEKDGSQIGDTTFEAFLKQITALEPGDLVISMIGGNQHAVLSTIQHPQPFDFFTPGSTELPEPGLEIIPYRALVELFATGLRKGDRQMLEAFRNATTARVVHIIPPPPKADNAFIEQHHERLFAKEGITHRGVSTPQLRLKFWALQTRVLRSMCRRLGIETIAPPLAALSDGFLRPEYYASDATHANWRYGERLLRVIEKRFLSVGPQR